MDEETSVLGVATSFNAAGFGDSLGGSVGSGLENLDVTDGEGDGDAGFIDLSELIDGDLIDSGFDVTEGDLMDSGFGDCCAVP